MEAIVAFVETFLSAPLQLVIILAAFGIFIYWWTKERPKERIEHKELITKLSDDANKAEERREKEREDYLKSLEAMRLQTQNQAIIYEKAVENCTKVIENNSRAMENLNLQIQNNMVTMDAVKTKVEASMELARVKFEDSAAILGDKIDRSAKTVGIMAQISEKLVDEIKEGLIRAKVKGEQNNE